MTNFQKFCGQIERFDIALPDNECVAPKKCQENQIFSLSWKTEMIQPQPIRIHKKQENLWALYLTRDL